MGRTIVLPPNQGIYMMGKVRTKCIAIRFHIKNSMNF